MLLALIRLTQAGHQLAGRVVLQLMLPKLGRMTNRTSGTTSENAWSEDRRHIAVAEFWDVVATYPVGRRTRRVAANLALETLHRLTAATRGPRPDLPVDQQDLHRSFPPPRQLRTTAPMASSPLTPTWSRSSAGPSIQG